MKGLQYVPTMIRIDGWRIEAQLPEIDLTSVKINSC